MHIGSKYFPDSFYVGFKKLLHLQTADSKFVRCTSQTVDSKCGPGDPGTGTDPSLSLSISGPFSRKSFRPRHGGGHFNRNPAQGTGALF